MRRPSRPSRIATSAWLVALLGALATGVPHTHVHDLGGDAYTTVSSAEHHSHGMRVLDQDDRVPATGFALPAASSRVEPRLPPPETPAWGLEGADTLRPTGRAPPAAHPRAPPHLA